MSSNEMTIVGLFTAPLQNLHGLIDARIAQLEAEQGPAEADSQEVEAETEVAVAAPSDSCRQATTEDRICLKAPSSDSQLAQFSRCRSKSSAACPSISP